MNAAGRFLSVAPVHVAPRNLEIRKDHTANFGDGTICVDGNVNAPAVALVGDRFDGRPSSGISVGLVGQIVIER